MNVHATEFQTRFDGDIDALGHDPIPAGPYYKPDYYEVEVEAVFRKTWLHFAHVCEVPEPGRFIVRRLDVANAELLITHAKDGSIRAFHNVCPHRGTRLVTEEEGQKNRFSCRYHMWTFGTDGALQSAPDFDNFYLDKAQCGLKPVAVEVCGGLIFVNLDKQPAQGLREFLGPLAEELDASLVARATGFTEYAYEIEANWKLAYDNFQEIYHLRFVHPRTAGPVQLGPDNPYGYPISFSLQGIHRTQYFWTSPAPQLSSTQLLGLTRPMQPAGCADDLREGHADRYLSIFPNLFVRHALTMPFTHDLRPLSPTRSRGIVRIYWVGDDANASMRFAREFGVISMIDVLAEDRNIVEEGQAGLSSGALEHIHFQHHEAMCRHLYKGVNDMVEAHLAERAAQPA